jgi:hypothetical protein
MGVPGDRRQSLANDQAAMLTGDPAASTKRNVDNQS